MRDLRVEEEEEAGKEEEEALRERFLNLEEIEKQVIAAAAIFVKAAEVEEWWFSSCTFAGAIHWNGSGSGSRVFWSIVLSSVILAVWIRVLYNPHPGSALI